VDDHTEVTQGSDPCDASDLGLPPDDIVTVPFQFFSNYASWEMTIRCVSGADTRTIRRVTRYWDYSTIPGVEVKLRKGYSYEVSMRWLESITLPLYPTTVCYTWRMQAFHTPSAPTTYYDYTENRRPGVAGTVSGVCTWQDPPFGWFIENAGGLFTTTVYQERIPTRNDAYVPLADRLTANLTIPKIELKTAYSDQLPDRTSNPLLSTGQTTMYMGARGDNKGYLKIEASVTPAEMAGRVLVGVRKMGSTTILASAPIQNGGKTPLSFNNAGNFQRYEVVAGLDVNSDGVLQ
jgi:hypothetical protein